MMLTCGPQLCHVDTCKRPGRSPTLQCDAPSKRKSGTCDRHLCPAHVHQTAQQDQGAFLMLTAAEAASLLGLKPRTVYDLARSGALPHFRPAPGAVRFALADIEAHLAACRSTGTSPAPAGGTSFRASLTDADDALQSYFRQRGLAPRPKPTPASATATSTPLQLVRSSRSR